MASILYLYSCIGLRLFYLIIGMDPPKSPIDNLNLISKNFREKLQFIRECDQQLVNLDTQASQLRKLVLNSLHSSISGNQSTKMRILDQKIGLIADKHQKILQLSQKKQKAASELFECINDYHKGLNLLNNQEGSGIKINKNMFNLELGVIQGHPSLKGGICFCRQYHFDELIKCANATCKVGLYHMSCVGRPQIKFDWHCENCLSKRKLISHKYQSEHKY